MDTKDPSDQDVKKNKWLIPVIAGLLLLALLLWLNRKHLQSVTSLIRPEAGERDREMELEVYLEGNEDSWNWKGTVAARVYSAVELEERMQEAENYIREHLAREGETLERVVSGVDLMTEIPDADVKVEWSWQDRELLDRDGNVVQEKLQKETILVLTAKLRCQDMIEQLEIPVCLVPEEISGTERQRRELAAWLDSQTAAGQEEAQLPLPDVWEEAPVSYTVSTEDSYWLLPLLMAGTLLLWQAHQKEEKKKKEKERKEELLLQYPDFVSRFVVLMGAGMNTSAVWLRLAGEYERSLSAGGNREALYEEVVLVAHRLRNGEQERLAYEDFGKRTNIQACQRFAVLLNQNLRMGTERILEQLEYEAAQALEDRKAQARRRGEEMGTKLLFPMLLQLLLILVMVMLPAFMSL